jgi:hypothetical protein
MGLSHDGKIQSSMKTNCSNELEGREHSERGVARTSGLVLNNRSQVRDNGVEHESLDVLHKQVTSTDATGAAFID